MKFMIYNILLVKYIIYGSKYEVILKPGRVEMEECALDLIFFKLGADHWFLWWWCGGGMCFFQQLRLDGLDKEKVFIFYHHKRSLMSRDMRFPTM